MLITSGIIWCFWSMILLSVAVSIVSLPQSLGSVKSYMIFNSIIGFFVGFYFIYITYHYKKNAEPLRLNRELFWMLRHNQLTVSIVAFALKAGIELNIAEQFIREKIKYSAGNLKLDNKGNVIYSEGDISKFKNSRKNGKSK